MYSVETFPLFPHRGTDQLICHVAIDLWSTCRMCAQKTVALQATKLQSVSECVIRVWAFYLKLVIFISLGILSVPKLPQCRMSEIVQRHVYVVLNSRMKTSHL